MGIMKQIVGCMQAANIKITRMDGQSLKLPPPATVKDVLVNHPDHSIYDMQTLQGLQTMDKPRPLPAWTPLKGGQIYFLVPNPDSILNPTTHPCPLCNTLHCKHGQEEEEDEDDDDDADGFSMAASKVAIMVDSQFEDLLASHCGDSEQVHSHRTRGWKPSLEIIYETETTV